MKTFLSGFCLLAVCLMLTNPSRKEDYFDYVSQQYQAALCQTGFPEFKNCDTLAPATTFVIRIVFSLHTEPANNYLLFTVYETPLPQCKVYGVGIAGRFIIVSPDCFNDF